MTALNWFTSIAAFTFAAFQLILIIVRASSDLRRSKK